MQKHAWRAVYILSLLLAALILTEIYEHATNTLAHNGHWFVTKAEIERRVGFGEHFQDMRVTLRRDRLDLGAWQSPHEVVYKKPLPIERIRFDSLLTEKSYLAIEFNRDASSFWAFRISRNPMYPPALLHVDPSGKFLSHTAVGLPPIASGWNRYELIQKDGKLSLLINGKEAYQCPFNSAPEQQFGFRNGRMSVLLDHISVLSPSGDVVANETFRNTNQYAWIFTQAVGFLVLLNLLIYFVRRTSRAREYAVRGISCNLVIVVCMAAYFTADWYRLSSIVHYPEQPVFSIFKWPEFISNAASDETVDRHPGIYRILFVGTSQTYGEGANTENDRWVNVVQRKFDALKTQTHYDCINAGKAGWTSVQLVPELRNWLKMGPNLVVIDLSTNDGNKEAFQRSLEELVALDQDVGAKTIFILEPNDHETTDVIVNTVNNHRVMREIAARRNLPVVDMHEYLSSAPVYDTGFLWWDYVHLTSYGQILFADKLFPALEKVIHTVN